MTPRAVTRVAVVGGGWAGLAAAVAGVRAGAQVTLFEMAPQLGGRAREVAVDGLPLDNGQHILIGAYRRTLALMRQVGAAPEQQLLRRPLALVYPDGRGLQLPPGAAIPAFVRAVLGYRGWGWRDRAALLLAAGRWGASGFACNERSTVAELTRALTPRVRTDLIDPLCVAALNTPAERASGRVFLRVLRDALFSGPGSADLLLPRASLGALLPAPAEAWLRHQGALLRTAHRVQALTPLGTGWQVDGEAFDSVVLAAPAREAARLTAALAPAWAARAEAFDYEPIVTVYLRCPGARLPLPMMALHDGPQAPAQFIFDLGALCPGRGTEGVMAMVVSGARDWVARGLEATGEAARAQALAALAPGSFPAPPMVLRSLAEKRATFLCTPGLDRPPADVAPGLWAAGDYVAGPYPATLEGAVISGEAAMQAALQSA
ncbi:hydroxysqualene dehydroxylase HpnE [Aquincola tertiaricarbonis]|uniref:Hydroxysqualene dehydroxylase HpnE n=1 Tax=Aquincola tertiaricarbonis TaxID=391953 RepID=A0ABY4S9U4_AQUTE|nr:hydroxysqualene dehydroxylase HpnE [Aquincola tertiaricarbonis]URI08970.1 hydroxysqualene dehydroxylase HpnE [Aquincola tertiaricarbonis]